MKAGHEVAVAEDLGVNEGVPADRGLGGLGYQSVDGRLAMTVKRQSV
jgi:hypothetical protein